MIRGRRAKWTRRTQYMKISSSVPPAPISLDGIWRFRFEEGKSLEEAADPEFEPTDSIAVPSCWDVMPKWYLKRGTGLYKRSFDLPRAVENAWLVVDGMGLRADFRIDGRRLGVHPYPYLRLSIETGPLSAGRHELFAALDNRFDWSTTKLARPYYDFYFYGGFYHGVSLEFDERRLVVRTRDWRTGTVEIEAAGVDEKDFPATLVFDGRNAVGAEFRGGRATVRVPDFRLWSPESPALHVVDLHFGRPSPAPDGSYGAPAASARFGIRGFEAKDRKFFLNGKPVFLRGVNRHETLPDSGTATTEATMVADIQRLKSLGGNFIRGAHYPQTRRFLDLCDEAGVLVWEESLGWGNGQPYVESDGDELADPAFAEAQVHQTREMVRASINHPCVVMYGFVNEIASHRPEAKALVDRLAAAVRAEDSGRLVTFACNHWFGDLCHDATDVVAFNAYPGTIPIEPGMPEELAEKVRNSPRDGFDTVTKLFREKYPDKTIMVSEAGCGGEYGLHDPAAGWCSEEFQEEYLRDILETLWANPDVAGFSIWQMNDNRTYHRNSPGQPGKPNAGFSIAGLFDSRRRPKLAAATVKRFFEAPPER